MMEDALQNLPERLEGLYADMLKRIPQDYKEEARLILMWLAYSLRPLTLQELASAVSIPNPLKVLEVCNSSLISLQRDGDRSPVCRLSKVDDTEHNFRNSIIKLDHFSVKEYLMSRRLLASDGTCYFHANPLVAHLTMAETLVSHILNTNDVDITIFETGQETTGKILISEQDHLPPYSTSWFMHANQADAIGSSMPGSKVLTLNARSAEAHLNLEVLKTNCHRLFCVEFSRSFRNWCFLLHISRDKFLWQENQLSESPIESQHWRDSSPILIASLFGMVDNVLRLLDDGVNIDGNLQSRATVTKPVQAAAIVGHLKVLSMLLERGASFSQFDLSMVARYNSRHGADVLITIPQSRQDLAITEKTVREFVSNLDSVDMLVYFLDAQDVLILTEFMFVDMLGCHWGKHPKSYLVDRMLHRLWLMISHSKNVLVTEPAMSHFAVDKDYSHIIFSMLMNHEKCDIYFGGTLVKHSVERHIHFCWIKIPRETMRAAARWEPAAVKYLQDHARPNVKFAKTLADAEPSSSDT